VSIGQVITSQRNSGRQWRQHATVKLGLHMSAHGHSANAALSLLLQRACVHTQGAGMGQTYSFSLRVYLTQI